MTAGNVHAHYLWLGQRSQEIHIESFQRRGSKVLAQNNCPLLEYLVCRIADLIASILDQHKHGQ